MKLSTIADRIEAEWYANPRPSERPPRLERKIREIADIVHEVVGDGTEECGELLVDPSALSVETRNRSV